MVHPSKTLSNFTNRLKAAFTTNSEAGVRAYIIAQNTNLLRENGTMIFQTEKRQRAESSRSPVSQQQNQQQAGAIKFEDLAKECLALLELIMRHPDNRRTSSEVLLNWNREMRRLELPEWEARGRYIKDPGLADRSIYALDVRMDELVGLVMNIPARQ